MYHSSKYFILIYIKELCMFSYHKKECNNHHMLYMNHLLILSRLRCMLKFHILLGFYLYKCLHMVHSRCIIQVYLFSDFPNILLVHMILNHRILLCNLNSDNKFHLLKLYLLTRTYFFDLYMICHHQR